jgi:hypothetical protein
MVYLKVLNNDATGWSPAIVTATVPDGDKGDIIVTGGVWEFDAAAFNADADARVAIGISSHEAASDPHPQYLTVIEGNSLYSPIGHTHFSIEISDFVESVQDVIGGILVTSGDLTWTYNDSLNSLSAVISTNTVTYAKMQDVSATARFIGRISGGAGDPEELTGTQATSLLDVFTAGLNGLTPASGGGTTNFLRADGTWAAPGSVSDGDKGDITVSGGGAVWTIDNDVITNAKLVDMATARIKGRITAGSGDPEDLTGTQATTLLDTFTAGLKGLVPPSGGGTTNFLRADGTFAAPPGGGGGSISTVEVDFTSPSSGKFFDVSLPGATAGQKVITAISTAMPTGVSEDELEMDPLLCYGEIAVNDQVHLFVGSARGSQVSGKRNVNLMVV